MAAEMIFLPPTQFRRVALALILVLTAGCQGPTGAGDRDRVWVGTLPRRDTDFDRRTWQDTQAGTVRQLMERLPDRIDSASEHRLARNLLISIADAPRGDDNSDQFVALRVNALIRLGNVGDAAALARAARTPPRDEAGAQQEIEAELLAGNVEMACIDLRALAARAATRWVEDGVAACKARAGEPGAMPPDMGGLGALARIAGAPLPATPPSGDPPGFRIAYLAAVGSDPKVPAARRLEAAFAAARASALDGDAYARILRSAAGHGQAAPGEQPPTSGEQAAALCQAIEQSADPARKLALAERGLLSPGGAVDGVSAAMAEPLRKVKPEPALAARFAAYFYAAGDPKAATPWADLAKRSGSDTAVWPYRALLQPTGSGEFAAWEKRAKLDPAGRDRIAAILSAFGIGSPPSSEPGQDDLQAIDKAAALQHVGETTLRALVILGSGGPAGASPQELHHVLAALDRVNLHNEARALAFEAIAPVIFGHPAPSAKPARVSSL
jgi:hypothetical protein